MKTLTISTYGSYSIAECKKTAKGKLKIKNIASDSRGEKMLKKAVAAFNRGEGSFWYCGDNFGFTVTDGVSGLF